MKSEGQSGAVSQRVRYIVRLIGQGVLTLLIFAFDLVKAVSGGGNSSSAMTSVVLVPRKKAAGPIDSHPTQPDRRRRTRGRTN